MIKLRLQYVFYFNYFGMSVQSKFRPVVYFLKLLMIYPSNTAFTIHQQTKSTLEQLPLPKYASPGPIYNTFGLSIKLNSASHSIGKAQRNQINHKIQKTPSPCHYDPNKLQTTIKHTIPKAQPNPQTDENPHPAWYHPQYKQTKPKILDYQLGNRYSSIMDEGNNNPGPGQYQIAKSLPILAKSKLHKQSMFGSARRFANKKEELHPGVGNYSINKKYQSLQPKISFGLNKRDSAVINEVPGPSDYRKISCFDQNIHKKIGKSISGKLKNGFQNIDFSSHSFIKYFQNPQSQLVSLRNAEKYSIGKSKHPQLIQEDSPGPTDYITNQFAHKDSCHAVIPQANANCYDDSIYKPGPGSYHLSGEDGIKYSVPRSKSMNKIVDGPGVGRYNISKLINQQKIGTIPKSNRSNFISNNHSGVGDYNISQTMSGKVTIGKAERFKKAQLPRPGPGDYHIHTMMRYKSQKL